MQFTAKQLDRNAKKCEKEEKADKIKLKKVHTLYSYIFVLYAFINYMCVCMCVYAAQSYAHTDSCW